MAYFLSDELNTLTTGSARMVVKTTPVAGNRRPNKFAKSCHKCGTWVPAQQGYLSKEAGAWVVFCASCP